MNKSVMKCCICNNENIGQFITINNKKYHLCCIEQLQQENKKLNGAIQTYNILLKSNIEENKQLKEVIDKAINDIDLVIELIKQQPTEDDSWILSRLNAFKIILKEVSE